MRRNLLGLVMMVLTAALAFGQTAAPAPAPAAPAGYAGPNVCFKCHIDFAKQWAGLKHSKTLLADGRPADGKGCEACHGPGAAHAGGKRKQIVAWDKLEQPDAAKVCLKCHQDKKVTAELWFKTPHSQILTCSDCHEVHKPVKREAMLKSAEGKDCSPCHDELSKKIDAKEHHILGKGDDALSCNMCHSVHGTTESHQLRKAQETLCKDCHEKTPKPETHAKPNWKLKHKADAKGNEAKCYKCHDQQTRCNSCHVVKIPHPENFAEKHEGQARKTPAACLNCHETKFCMMCHEKMPKGFGPPAAPGAAPAAGQGGEKGGERRRPKKDDDD